MDIRTLESRWVKQEGARRDRVTFRAGGRNGDDGLAILDQPPSHLPGIARS